MIITLIQLIFLSIIMTVFLDRVFYTIKGSSLKSEYNLITGGKNGY